MSPKKSVKPAKKSSSKATPGHLVYLIQDFPSNVDFYKDMFDYLGFDTLMSNDMFHAVQSGDLSLWFMAASDTTLNNRDAHGLNHLGLHLDSPTAVDEFITDFLNPNGIAPLFDTPRHRPDFAGENGTYYQVMFQLPGDLLFEVVHTKWKPHSSFCLCFYWA